MKLDPGVIISHRTAPQWGSGKVLDVAADKVTIIFSDGETRKIKESHLDALQAADPDSYQEPVKKAPLQRTKKADGTSSKPRPTSPKPSQSNLSGVRLYLSETAAQAVCS